MVILTLLQSLQQIYVPVRQVWAFRLIVQSFGRLNMFSFGDVLSFLHLPFKHNREWLDLNKSSQAIEKLNPLTLNSSCSGLLEFQKPWGDRSTPPFFVLLTHGWNQLQWTAVQRSAVQFSAVQLNAAQCSAVHRSVVQCSAVQCSAAQFSTVQFSAAKCSPVHQNAVQLSSVGCSVWLNPAFHCMSEQCSLVNKIAWEGDNKQTHRLCDYLTNLAQRAESVKMTEADTSPFS